MREVGVLEARTSFSALIEEVETIGEPVTITRHGRPVVIMVPTKGEAEAPQRFGAEGRPERLARLRAQIAAERPELMQRDWDDLKRIARE